MNLDSLIEWTIHICLDDFEDIAPPLMVKIHPLMSLVSIDLVIQFALQYSLTII